MERTQDLIVGQGIAGSVLAWTLYEEGRDFHIVDRDEGADCSMVSGGMMNPISPRIPTMTWRADVHLPEAEHFYTSIENRTGEKFYHARPIYRPYKDADEKERWEGNARKKGYDRFLWPKPPTRIPGVHVDPDLGVAAFQGAYLDTPAFLDCSSRHFLREGLLLRTNFDPEDLKEKDGYWEWNGIRFQRLILCQGIGIRDCPFFAELPLRPNKGEILTVRMPDLPEHFILNSGFYAIPLGEGKVRIGATYDHEDMDPSPTRSKKEDLLSRLEKWIDLPYELLDHQVGFRPTTPDTRPYVGFHRKHRGIAVFNGLGSKGATLAPHWAKRLTAKLKTKKEEAPDPEVDPERFGQKKKASKS
jgi:glycine/D-amino acid oxidase-like deaminating enzyme